MILRIEFYADPARWRVRVPETGFALDLANLMTYDANGIVVAIGEPHPPTELLRDVPIYDARNFDPLNTIRCVRYLVLLSAHARTGLAQILDLFDRYDLTFHLPGYDEIPEGARRAFERDLRGNPFSRSYTINGRLTKLPWNMFR